MKTCTAAILVILTALWFWVGWLDRLQQYVAETESIKSTLESRGFTNVRVYPKSAGCYTYNALENDQRQVNGKVCLPEQTP